MWAGGDNFEQLLWIYVVLCVSHLYMSRYTGDGQNNGNTKKLGTEFVCIMLKELQLGTLTVLLLFVYTLWCSCQCVSVGVEWQSARKNQKFGDFSDFERGKIVGAHLAVAFLTKTVTLLGVSKAPVFKVMSAYTIHGKATSSEEEQWVKINTDRKQLLYIENCFKTSQNYCSTGDSTTECSSSRPCFHKNCLWA
jgi:hypothetical protein